MIVFFSNSYVSPSSINSVLFWFFIVVNRFWLLFTRFLLFQLINRVNEFGFYDRLWFLCNRFVRFSSICEQVLCCAFALSNFTYIFQSSLNLVFVSWKSRWISWTLFAKEVSIILQFSRLEAQLIRLRSILGWDFQSYQRLWYQFSTLYLGLLTADRIKSQPSTTLWLGIRLIELQTFSCEVFIHWHPHSYYNTCIFHVFSTFCFYFWKPWIVILQQVDGMNVLCKLHQK